MSLSKILNEISTNSLVVSLRETKAYELLSLAMSNLKIINQKYGTKVILIGALTIIFTGSTLSSWIRMKRHFKKINLDGPTPLPLLGNLFDLMSQGFSKYDEKIFKKYGKICGYFEGSTPIILIADTQLIKAITIKDASYFLNRRVIEGIQIEPFKHFMSVIKDEEWKNVRSIVTTSFTSAKLKEMSYWIQKCSNAVNDHIGRLVEEDKELDVKTIFGSLTLDVISSCLFGLETNAISDPENLFLKNLRIFFGTTLSGKLALVFMFPKLTQFLAEKGIFNLIPVDCINYLTAVSDEIITRRRNKQERRNDFIQNMVDHEEKGDSEKSKSKNQKDEKSADLGTAGRLSKKLSNKEIISQAILFMAAGYDTTATTLGFISYNLALNPHCQTKLINEIDQVLEKYNGEVNYDSINEMTYLEMVIFETLRMWPPAFRTDRECNEDYEYKGIKISKGSIVGICIWAVHHDPDIYPEPEVFNPDRFSDEQKKLRDNESFIPFGSGLRSCVGMRFALIEMKLFLAEFFSKYYFVTSENTPKKVTLANTGLLRVNETLYVKAKARH